MKYHHSITNVCAVAMKRQLTNEQTKKNLQFNKITNSLYIETEMST